MQHGIITPGPLHDEQGLLTETGYATSLIKQYDRNRVKASRLRIKEWDYYCIVSDCYALALTIADNGYMYMDSVSLLDFSENAQATKSVILPPFGKRSLPATSEKGDIHVSGKGYEMTFENDGKRRRLYGHMDHFPTGKPEDETLLFDVTLTQPPRDSMVIVTPFAEKPTAFYYNQKINCLRAEGKVVHGEKEYLFAPAHSFAVLDWGRGVWTYDNTWYWGSASGLADGISFGFNIGYGFGDTSAASENMLFYDGTAHKLSQVRFEIPLKDGKEDYLSPWKFTSDDGRFEMDFAPLMDRSALIDLKLLCSDQHQVFGRFTGKAVLDDGREIQVRNLTGFAEKVHNKW
ncbi:MAG: DUF2804 domain-containing protein [Clostridia bacterium]|nr:DUF2804 domain-containing protein [Clostridia bacterium]